jgi:hypothetical protein
MARYKTSAWEWHRRQILKRDLYSCQMCGVLLSSGKRDHRAAVVDHKRPARLRPDLFLDPANTWAVCKRCHDSVCHAIEVRHGDDAEAIARAKEAYRPVGLDGYPITRPSDRPGGAEILGSSPMGTARGAICAQSRNSDWGSNGL